VAAKSWDDMSAQERLEAVRATLARMAEEEARAEEPTPLDRLRAALVDSAGLQDMAEPVPLVGKILFKDSLCWVYGPPASCKTFVALDIAGCVGTGEPWQGCGPTQAGAVLYVVAEGVSGIRARVRAWESAMGSVMTGVRFLPVAVQAGNAQEWQALVELATELQPALIVLDTQARVATGIEENSATEMGRFVQQVERLRRATGACVVIVHHTGRTGEHMRGSIAMDGAATTLIKVSRSEEIVEVEIVKQKDAPESAPLRLRLVPYEGSIILSGTDYFSPSTVDTPGTVKLVSAWWNTFETDWVSATRLSEVAGVAKTTLWRRLNDLVKAHIVEVKGDSPRRFYRLREKPNVPTVPRLFQDHNETRDIHDRNVPPFHHPLRGGTVGTERESWSGTSEEDQ
jgi:hypothetical protein